MAFVTNYTLSKLAQSLEIKEEVTEQVFVEHIFNDKRLFQFFNKFELKYLFNYKKLLENNLNELKYYVEVPTSKDTQTYVFEKESKLNYHLYQDCEFLNKDFRGFIIPAEIGENNLITEYRKWFIENNFQDRFDNGDINKDLIVFNYNSKFSNQYNLPKLNPNYSLIKEIPNSGKNYVTQSFDVELFLVKIEDCLRHKRDLLNTKDKRILAKFEWLKNKPDDEIIEELKRIFGYSSIEINQIKYIKKLWNQYSKIKRGVILKELIEYFKWNYRNKSNDLDRYTLESFNLKCCSNCEKLEQDNTEENDKPKNNRVENDDLPF
jgi:hypothetical protein